MRYPTVPSTPDAEHTRPASCPLCQSAAIVTSAKIPDATSYWRCTNCGEVWNSARSQPTPYGGRRWR